MQRMVHSLSCLLLALALVLSGPGSIGPANGAMLVELCAGDTPTMVWIDAEGNPVEPAIDHAKCPDCLIFSAPLPEAAALRSHLTPLPVPTGLSLAIPPLPEPIAHLRPDTRGSPTAQIDSRRTGGLRPVTWSLHPTAPTPLDSCQAALPAPVSDLRASLQDA